MIPFLLLLRLGTILQLGSRESSICDQKKQKSFLFNLASVQKWLIYSSKTIYDQLLFSNYCNREPSV